MFMQYSNYIAATYSISHSPCTSTHPTTFHNLPMHTDNKHKSSWQNSTRCRDVVKVLSFQSYLVWLVFESSIPTCTCFHSENSFVSLIIYFVKYMHKRPVFFFNSSCDFLFKETAVKVCQYRAPLFAVWISHHLWCNTWVIFKSTMQGPFLWLIPSLDVAMLPYSPTMWAALEMRVHWSSVPGVHCCHHQPAIVLTQWSVLSVRGTPPPSLSAALEIFVLLVDRGRVRAEWRSV